MVISGTKGERCQADRLLQLHGLFKLSVMNLASKSSQLLRKNERFGNFRLHAHMQIQATSLKTLREFRKKEDFQNSLQLRSILKYIEGLVLILVTLIQNF